MSVKMEILRILEDGQYHTYNELKMMCEGVEGCSQSEFDSILKELIRRREIISPLKDLYVKNMVLRSVVVERYKAALYRLDELIETVAVCRADLFEDMASYKYANAIVEIKKILYDTLKEDRADQAEQGWVYEDNRA